MIAVNNTNELESLLKDKYGDNINFAQKDYYCLYGTLYGKKIEIEPCDDGVTVAVDLGEEALLNELISYFNQITKSSPICQYNLADADGVPMDITVEWNSVNPDNRMERILTGRGFNKGYKAINLTEYHLSNDRKMTLAEWNKFSPTLFKGLHVSDEKLYQHFTECSEADLALIIKTLANFWSMVHSQKWKDIWPEPSDIQTACEQAWIQVEKRFLNNNTEVGITTQTMAWAKWWSDYFNIDIHLAYMQKRIADEDVSEFRPTGSWEDLIANPVTIETTNNNLTP